MKAFLASLKIDGISRYGLVSVRWQVSDAPLYSLSMDVQGRMLGVGSQNGVVTLIRPSESLVELQRQEKAVINSVSSLSLFT